MMNLFNSKKLVLLVVSGLLLITLTLSAQDTKRGGKGEGNGRGGKELSAEQVDEMIAEMITKLSLTDDQTVKITELFKTHFAEVEAMQEEKSSDRDAQRTKMDELRKGFDEKVNALLTVEQQKLFKDMDRGERTGRNESKSDRPRGKRN